MVVTNDAHYLKKDDAFAHDVLLCIGTQKTFADPDRLKYASNEFYVKTAAEMHALFPQDGAAVENTLLVAERCQLEIPMGQFHLPQFPVPAGTTLDGYLFSVAREGLAERLEELRRRKARGVELATPAEEVYRERLERELQVIAKMGFPGYFLVVWDFCRHARDNGIPVGPGRGSAAASLVSYSLRITDIDPLQYDLLSSASSTRRGQHARHRHRLACAGAARSSTTQRQVRATRWRRSSPSAPWPHAPSSATSAASWGCPTARSTASPRWCPR